MECYRLYKGHKQLFEQNKKTFTQIDKIRREKPRLCTEHQRELAEFLEVKKRLAQVLFKWQILQAFMAKEARDENAPVEIKGMTEF